MISVAILAQAILAQAIFCLRTPLRCRAECTPLHDSLRLSLRIGIWQGWWYSHPDDPDLQQLRECPPRLTWNSSQVSICSPSPGRHFHGVHLGASLFGGGLYLWRVLYILIYFFEFSYGHSGAIYSSSPRKLVSAEVRVNHQGLSSVSHTRFRWRPLRFFWSPG